MKRLVATAVCLFSIVAACKAKKAPGEIVVAIDSDLTPGIDFDEIHIDVIVQGVTPPDIPTIKEFGQPAQPYSFPMTYAIVSNGDPSTKVQIRVAAGLSSGGGHSVVGLPLLLREVTTTVPVDRVALLRIHLEWLCIGYAKQNPAPDTYVEGNCPIDGLTCVAGECVDFGLDSSTFPDYDDALVFGGGHAGAGDGMCFDTLACFAGAEVVTPDAGCTIPMPPGDAARVNIGLVSPRCEGGICDDGSATCVVPLDTATPAGWTEIGGRIHLPPAACRKTQSVLVSTSCATKTASTPTCGPWSEIRAPGGTFNASFPDAGAPATCADAAAE